MRHRRGSSRRPGIKAPPSVGIAFQFSPGAFRTEKQTFRIEDERIENERPNIGQTDPSFYYRYQQGQPAINTRDSTGWVKTSGAPYGARATSALNATMPPQWEHRRGYVVWENVRQLGSGQTFHDE